MEARFSIVGVQHRGVLRNEIAVRSIPIPTKRSDKESVLRNPSDYVEVVHDLAYARVYMFLGSVFCEALLQIDCMSRVTLETLHNQGVETFALFRPGHVEILSPERSVCHQIGITNNLKEVTCSIYTTFRQFANFHGRSCRFIEIFHRSNFQGSRILSSDYCSS